MIGFAAHDSLCSGLGTSKVWGKKAMGPVHASLTTARLVRQSRVASSEEESRLSASFRFQHHGPYQAFYGYLLLLLVVR